MEQILNDEELVARFIQSNEATYFAELYKRYRLKVYQACIQVLADSDEAHDQTQEVFYKVFLHLSGFRNESSFATWLLRLTYNHCFSYRKRLKARTGLSISDIGDVVDETSTDWPTLDERWKVAEQVLATLQPADKELLWSRYVLKKSVQVLAQEHQVSAGAMKMRLKRTRDLVQKLQKRRRFR